MAFSQGLRRCAVRKCPNRLDSDLPLKSYGFAYAETATVVWLLANSIRSLLQYSSDCCHNKFTFIKSVNAIKKIYCKYDH